jgi:hypothetical protein
MDNATPAALKEMFRVIKHLIQTKHMGLKISPNITTNTVEEWKLQMYSDSTWGSCLESRKSITGFIILLFGTPILWKSQTQKTVALSSTEAEYYALAEAVKEVKFVVQIMESLGLKINKPIIVNVDNVGTIFVAENSSATKHTRHIDARYHFVREYIIDGQIKITFVMSKNNLADMFTKNINSEIYQEQIGNLLIHRQVVNLTSNELESYDYFDSGGVSDHRQDVMNKNILESKLINEKVLVMKYLIKKSIKDTNKDIQKIRNKENCPTDIRSTKIPNKPTKHNNKYAQTWKTKCARSPNCKTGK